MRKADFRTLKRGEKFDKKANNAEVRKKVDIARGDNRIQEVADKRRIAELKAARRGKVGHEKNKADFNFREARLDIKQAGRERIAQRAALVEEMTGVRKYAEKFKDKFRDPEFRKSAYINSGIIASAVALSWLFAPAAIAYAGTTVVGKVLGAKAASTVAASVIGGVKGNSVTRVRHFADKKRDLTDGTLEELERQKKQKRWATAIGAMSLGASVYFHDFVADLYHSVFGAPKATGNLQIVNTAPAGHGPVLLPVAPAPAVAPGILSPLDTITFAKITNTEDIWRTILKQTKNAAYLALDPEKQKFLIENLDQNLLSTHSSPAVRTAVMQALNIDPASGVGRSLLRTGTFHGMNFDQVIPDANKINVKNIVDNIFNMDIGGRSKGEKFLEHAIKLAKTK